MKKFIKCPYCKHKLKKGVAGINSLGDKIHKFTCNNCDAYFCEDSPEIKRRIKPNRRIE